MQNSHARYEYFTDDNHYALYDLDSDPTESRNLASANPEKLKSMMQAMLRELESMHALYPVRNGRQLKPAIP